MKNRKNMVFEQINNNDEIAVYIHWPFCRKKCFYCDLNSHVREKITLEHYFEGLLKEISLWKKHKITSIFFGGGTPSLMKPEWIQAIISELKKWSTFIPEITLEVNPSSLESYSLERFRDAGINRISFGVQSFDDQILQFLGRTHTAQEAIQWIRKAQQLFSNMSIDLMYGIPNQSLQTLKETLDVVLNLNLPHISLYALTLEKNTKFGQLYERAQLKMPQDDLIADQYELILQKLKHYLHYEISNFAKNESYRSKHNLTYWRYKPFIGIGPGAHSRIWIDNEWYAIHNLKLPEQWLQKVQNNTAVHDLSNLQNNIGIIEKIDQKIFKMEQFLMNLRTHEGISLVNNTFLQTDKLQKLHDVGDAIYDANISFRLTNKGFLRYNAIFRYLFDQN